jgi:hypothetical protein
MAFVEVEVHLDEFDTDDVIDYLERQGYTVLHSAGSHLPMNNPTEELRLIWEAMYLGKPYDAMVRKIVSDHTGRFL